MLILLRHGEIKANRQRLWHGATDSSLTWRGRRQAKHTATYLKASGRSIDKLVSSPLQRCRATARSVARVYGLEASVDERLREMSVGDWEGMPFKQLRDEHNLFKQLTTDTRYHPPSGESLQAVAERMLPALLALDTETTTTMVVSHGVAMAVALAKLVDGDEAHWGNYHFHNCSLTELRLKPSVQVVSFNQYAHL